MRVHLHDDSRTVRSSGGADLLSQDGPADGDGGGSSKGTGVSTTVQYTRYTAVDLASCRKLGVVTIPGKTWEVAWDSDGGDYFWFTQNLDFKDGRSFRGAASRVPEDQLGRRLGEGQHPAPRGLAGRGAGDSDSRTGRKTPVPEDAIELAQRRWTSNGARQLLALAPNATDGGVDVLVVDQPSGDGPPSFRRETLAVEGVGPQRVGLSPDDSAIVFAHAQGLVEAFDSSKGAASCGRRRRPSTRSSAVAARPSSPSRRHPRFWQMDFPALRAST